MTNHKQSSLTVRKKKHEGNAWVLLSGGLDSSACVAFYKNLNFSVHGIFIDYGQIAAKRELSAARSISKYYDIPLHQLKWSGLNQKGAGLIVGRNAFLLMAALMELPLSSGILAIGIHAGTNYLDCSKSFVKEMQSLFDLYTGGCIQIGAPFIGCNKKDIWDYCISNDVPVQLTYSCEKGLKQPCGQCLSCKDLEVLYACS
jgi:7-cyano-7-deazaguanine synthase